ncbi:hypothetical protein PVAG01_03315 [Phlyctema vagabunda]|uniref:Uncharacterized protein n=1 Tax=Phlyctema vagabunda TaxID=108571 RepID=A0ABR4PL45_9HELO
MAFRQPTYHAPQRASYVTPEHIPIPARPSEAAIEESQEWILFSPVTESTADVTNTTSTGRTCTAGRSRMSDFGSLDTRARSDAYDDEAAEDDEDEEEDEGASTEELDSLDSHLHEFRADPSVYNRRESSGSRAPVLPTHDGLGSFRLDQTAMGDEVQEHLYAFERYNPRRIKRRRESLEMGALELAGEQEKARRIEAWRLEQSRVLVEEIQKETRRRRKQSMVSERMSIIDDETREQDDAATFGDVEDSIQGQETAEGTCESLWNRITRKVIRDLMGFDDHLLSIIFGEALPEDDDLSTTPPAKRTLASSEDEGWEARLLERITKELGVLVNQISDHPGAFSTYLRTQQEPLPYAGLSAIPETARQSPTVPTMPEFQPTLPIPMQASAHRIEETSDDTPRASPSIITREEWERDLDIKMVFRYLRGRFSPSREVETQGPSKVAAALTSDTAARAARVRAHHPLVSTRRPSSTSQDRRIGLGLGVRRHSGNSSCADASAKRSSSSRHYWDLGGSIGSGGTSIIASTGAMGSWGEV